MDQTTAGDAMTLTELDRESGNGAVSVPDVSTPTAKPRRRRWPWAVAVVAGAVVVAFVVIALLAGAYQPLEFGGSWGGTVPGLGATAVGRNVNNFGGQTGQFYIPPRRTAFTIVESIQNSGPTTVTIEDVSLAPPNEAYSWPLRAAGQALYMPEYYRGKTAWRVGRPVDGLSLGPSQAIVVGIPARMSGACYQPNSSTGATVFYVQMRFLTFTKWVALPLGTPLLMREPEPRGNNPGLICPK
jgi:hypothetical protein